MYVSVENTGRYRQAVVRAGKAPPAVLNHLAGLSPFLPGNTDN